MLQVSVWQKPGTGRTERFSLCCLVCTQRFSVLWPPFLYFIFSLSLSLSLTHSLIHSLSVAVQSDLPVQWHA